VDAKQVCNLEFIRENLSKLKSESYREAYSELIHLTGLREPGQPGIEDGAHGHFYMYWVPPAADKPGGLLIGCEGSSFVAWTRCLRPGMVFQQNLFPGRKQRVQATRVALDLTAQRSLVATKIPPYKTDEEKQPRYIIAPGFKRKA